MRFRSIDMPYVASKTVTPPSDRTMSTSALMAMSIRGPLLFRAREMPMIDTAIARPKATRLTSKPTGMVKNMKTQPTCPNSDPAAPESKIKSGERPISAASTMVTAAAIVMPFMC